MKAFASLVASLVVLASAQTCTLPILFNSDLFVNEQGDCAPSGRGCTVATLLGNPPTCAPGTRQDPVLDWSAVICKANRKFSEPVGGCIENLCAAPFFPNGQSPVATCNSDQGCDTASFNSAPIVCNPNFVGGADQTGAICPFTSGSVADFRGVTGSCEVMECKIPAQFSGPAYLNQCSSVNCTFSQIQGLACAEGYAPYTGAPIDVSNAVCNAASGLWENILGVCVVADPPAPMEPMPEAGPMVRVPVPVVNVQDCMEVSGSQCKIGPDWSDRYDCETGLVEGMSTNCIDQGCSRNLFGTAGFRCYCKQIPEAKRINGNNLVIGAGSCCPGNSMDWQLNPAVGVFHNSGYDAQCNPDGSDATTI